MTPRERNIGKYPRPRSWILLLLLSAAVCIAAGETTAQEPRQSTAASNPTVAADSGSQTIIIGFLGGYVSGDNPVRSEVRMARHLRATYPKNVRVETLANRGLNDAYKEILKFIAGGRDGNLSEEQKRRARIILYGHSWGGTAAIALARKLQQDGVPVLLTIQVDSVKHSSVDDSVIPSNVAKAANFYQNAGLLHGREKIRAADPSRTSILANSRYDYVKNPVQCHGYPFWDRWFSKTHMQIECDPKVWDEVESLIRAELPPAAALSQAH
jgi:hypothetical protein